jgi:hypothetical protein
VFISYVLQLTLRYRDVDLLADIEKSITGKGGRGSCS